MKSQLDLSLSLEQLQVFSCTAVQYSQLFNMPLTLSTMKAFRTVGDKKAAVVDYQIPAPSEDQILVEVEAVGQSKVSVTAKMLRG